jgi:hypothetical protein
VEVAEKRVFFWQKWLKNVCFFGRSGRKMCVFWAEVSEKNEVAEKRAFFRWKWLKNMHFLGRSV